MPYIGNTVQNQGFTPAIDYFSGNGVTVTFTLTRPVSSVAQMIVAVDNVIQNPSSAFTVAGSAITFTSAPLSGTNNIWVEYTSLITTYAAISQDPTVIGDITTTGGGLLSTGDFGNAYLAGTIVDYVTGTGRVTVGPSEGITLYNGGTSARASLLALTANGALGVGTTPSYGTAGQVLQSNGPSAAPSWITVPYTADYLIVAGGGSCKAGEHATGGGGGGAGGAIDAAISLISGNTYSIVIGAGGAGAAGGGNGNNGSNSTGFSQTAIGGGAGGAYPGYTANSGGSGGGGGYTSPNTPGSGTTGQGSSGGYGLNSSDRVGGGGGGAGGAGGSASGSNSTAVAGNGGVGINWKSLGTYYAGGGGGGAAPWTEGGKTAGTGGLGGGGNGARASSQVYLAGANGSANTGGGAGGSSVNGPAGGSQDNQAGASGGSGIVIIRYLGSQKGTGGTVTSSGGYTYHTFTSSGTYTA